MRIEFKPAVRSPIALTIGIVGPTGAGKTLSSIRMAHGLCGGARFAFGSTEGKKETLYARDYGFDRFTVDPPFKPSVFADVILAAESAGYPLVVIDSGSKMQEGRGGMLDWHDDEMQRLDRGRGKPEKHSFSAWAAPKADMQRLIDVLESKTIHVIFALKAGDKSSQEKEDPEDQRSKTVIVPKRTMSGFVGMIPTAPKELPYELFPAFVLYPDAPGVPTPTKVQYDLRPLLRWDAPIDEEFGATIRRWNLEPPRITPAIVDAIRDAAAGDEATRKDLESRVIVALNAGANESAIIRKIRATKPAAEFACPECGQPSGACDANCSLQSAIPPA